jgi:hypothetical protein
MEEPNVDDGEQTMGFYTNNVQCQIFQKVCESKFLVHVMDFNYLTWILSLGMAKYMFFAPLHQPSHPYFYCCTDSLYNHMLMQGG